MYNEDYFLSGADIIAGLDSLFSNEDFSNKSGYKKQNDREREFFLHSQEPSSDDEPDTKQIDDKEYRDNRDMKMKRLFDDKERYYYYCEFIDRYVDMHGLRGIKDRNIKYLQQLGKTTDSQKEHEIIWSLVENNRPIAIRQAMIFYSVNDWTQEDLQDAYEETLILMAETYERRLAEIKEMDIKKFGYLNLFICKNACKAYKTKLEHLKLSEIDTLPMLDEEDALLYSNVPHTLLMDKVFFDDLLATVLPVRERYILTTYLFGDEIKGIPGIIQDDYMNVLEAIGEYVGLSRERVRQIKEKAIRKIRTASRNCNGEERMFYVVEDSPDNKKQKIENNLLLSISPDEISYFAKKIGEHYRNQN